MTPRQQGAPIQTLTNAISGQLLFADAQDRLYDLAAARVGEGLINALQLVKANKPLNR